jgi:hypothetical protein
MFSDEITLNQIKNLRRKIVAKVWEITPVKVIEIALFIGVQVPKQLIDKYISSKQD